MKHLITGKLLFILAGIVLCLSACSKDEENALSRTDLLTSSKWVFSDAVHADEVAQAGLVLEFTGMEITFLKDGTYSLYEPFDQQTNDGIWEFTNSEASILIDKNSVEEDEVNIVSLADNNLQVTLTDVDLGTFDIIFTH